MVEEDRNPMKRKHRGKCLVFGVFLLIAISVFISTKNVCKYGTWKMTHSLGPGSIDIIHTDRYGPRTLFIKRGTSVGCVLFCYGNYLSIFEFGKGYISVNHYMPI